MRACQRGAPPRERESIPANVKRMRYAPLIRSSSSALSMLRVAVSMRVSQQLPTLCRDSSDLRGPTKADRPAHACTDALVGWLGSPPGAQASNTIQYTVINNSHNNCINSEYAVGRRARVTLGFFCSTRPLSLTLLVRFTNRKVTQRHPQIVKSCFLARSCPPLDFPSFKGGQLERDDEC